MSELRRRFGVLLRNAYHADRRTFLAYLAAISVSQTAPLIAALLVRVLVDGIAQQDRGKVVLAAVLLAVTVTTGFAVARLRLRVVHVLVERSTEAYDREIMRLSADLPGIDHLENPVFLDRLEQLRFQPYALGQNGTQATVLVWGSLQAALTIAVLLSVHPSLLMLLVVAVPSVVASRQAEKARFDAFDAASPSRRRSNHAFELAASPRYADEIRTLNLEADLLRRHDDEWAAADRQMTSAELRAAGMALAGRLLFAAAYLGAIVIVVNQGIHGQLSAGDVVLTVVLAGLLNQQLAVIVQATSQVLHALQMIGRYLWLVDYAAGTRRSTDPEDPPATLTRGLRLDGVSFRYPHSDVVALHDVDLDFPAGQVIAIVGDNGAGKTTLVKLLLAMYAPTTGTITVDGQDLTRIDPVDWRQRTTAAFQDYTRFELLLGESVGIGDLPRVDDHDEIRRALSDAGAHDLEPSLPNGLHTPLGASFEDGTFLSGGQWQRVALSRAGMRQRPLLTVFDEPTSNLDADAERLLFNHVAVQARALAESGAITVLISHRFSTVRAADRIIVLSRGTVVETGTHEELIAADGLYAELYQLQAASYQ